MSDFVSVLISLKTFSGKGTATLKQVLQQLSSEFKVEGVSSVYKVNRLAESLTGLRDSKQEEHLDGLAMVVRISTNKSPRKTFDELTKIEANLQREVLKRSISLNLMIYGNEILMLPGLAVPHPEMHLRPEELVLAVEVWPDYIHPVLRQPLHELSRCFVNTDWGEFFTQGQPLLDFLQSEE